VTREPGQGTADVCREGDKGDSASTALALDLPFYIKALDSKSEGDTYTREKLKLSSPVMFENVAHGLTYCGGTARCGRCLDSQAAGTRDHATPAGL
jgi:hypothetical protein